jgi:4-hydroxy-4-methyl-2-oxoglutarate aldolase
MKSRFKFAILAGMSLAGAAAAQQPDLRAGHSYIDTHVYSAEEDRNILRAFDGLRVADVTDGMDFVGLQNVGLMDPDIHPQWRDEHSFAHRFVGIAVTVRYVPTQRGVIGGGRTYEDFRAREGNWYNQLSPEPFQSLIRPGTAIVIDDAPDADVGSIGSYNILAWHVAGAVGVVTDATSRDVDEVETEHVPLYLRHVGRGIRPGRNEVESVNRPVVVGGVLVNPGDVIVADGDGVVVVPRAVALQVAGFAQRIGVADRAARRDLYRRARLPADTSIRQ